MEYIRKDAIFLMLALVKITAMDMLHALQTVSKAKWEQKIFTMPFCLSFVRFGYCGGLRGELLSRSRMDEGCQGMDNGRWAKE